MGNTKINSLYCFIGGEGNVKENVPNPEYLKLISFLGARQVSSIHHKKKVINITSDLQEWEIFHNAGNEVKNYSYIYLFQNNL